MSSQTKDVYEFADFCLDPSEKLLLNNGTPVPLTPKVFDTLQVLVENAGNLIEKNDLMKRIWEDRFVEDSNLTYNIKTLRRALGDDAANPRFIETVPRRGYRFIAAVSKITNKNGRIDNAEKVSGEPVEKSPVRSPRTKVLSLVVVAGLIAGLFIAGVWYFGVINNRQAVPLLSSPFASEKISTSGKVFSAAITPDGKRVVYTIRNEGKQSVWLRQIESGENIEIIPPSDDVYYLFAFSPDGDFLYFTRQPKGPETNQADIYRISIHGGIPTRIVTQTQGQIDISPDGEKVSFVRCSYREDDFCSLWIANSSDGGNERRITFRRRPFRIADNKFSPDGKTIVFAVGQSENQASDFGLMAIDPETGVEREFTTERFFNIKHLDWLPDSNGLLLTAAKISNKPFRIWHVSAGSGEIMPLTKDSESYSVLSLDKSGNRLIATQIKQDFQLLLFNTGAATAPRVLADASWGGFGYDGKIFYSSTMSGNEEVWCTNTDGTGSRQLTNDGADDIRPIVSQADGSIFFSSNRGGEADIWRMNADGSNQVRITAKDGGFPIAVSPDGQWLFYHHGLDRTLWRVPAKGGEGEVVFDKRKYLFAVSPDTSRVAFSEREGEDMVLIIASLADGKTLNTFRITDKEARPVQIAWLPDGNTIAYTLVSTKSENNSLWSQSYDGGKPKKLADLGEKEVKSLSFSPDGKSFAVVQGSWKHDAVLFLGLK